jgi:hypothetical protein
MEASELAQFMYTDESPNVQKFVQNGYIDKLLTFIHRTCAEEHILNATNMMFYIVDSDYKMELFAKNIIADLIIILRLYSNNTNIRDDCIIILTEYFTCVKGKIDNFVDLDGLNIITDIFRRSLINDHFKIMYLIKQMINQGLDSKKLLRNGFIDHCEQILPLHATDSVVYEMIHMLIDDSVNIIVAESEHGLRNFEIFDGINIVAKICENYKNYRSSKIPLLLDAVYKFILYDNLGYKKLLQNGLLNYCVDAIYLHEDSSYYIISYFLVCYIVLQHQELTKSEQNIAFNILVKIFRQSNITDSEKYYSIPNDVVFMLNSRLNYKKVFKSGFVDDCVKALPRFNQDSIIYDRLLHVIRFCFDKSLSRFGQG